MQRFNASTLCPKCGGSFVGHQFVPRGAKMSAGFRRPVLHDAYASIYVDLEAANVDTIRSVCGQCRYVLVSRPLDAYATVHMPRFSEDESERIADPDQRPALPGRSRAAETETPCPHCGKLFSRMSFHIRHKHPEYSGVEVRGILGGVSV